MRTCEACGEELPALARRNQKYCDARCRRRAYDERHAPAAPGLASVVAIDDEEDVRQVIGRADAEERLVAYVAAAARTNWRASAWLLERGYPERWSPVRRRGGRELEPVPVDDQSDPFYEIDQLAARRRRQAGPGATRRPRAR